MAAGIMPVLVGGENDNRGRYLSADKRYRGKILFGIRTDTFDMLGIPSLHCRSPNAQTKANTSKRHCVGNSSSLPVTKSALQEAASKFVGKQAMKYPPYSSKTVALDGQKVPLWQVSRANRLDDVQIPSKEIAIYSLRVTALETLTSQYIANYITHFARKLDGDFRQKEIIRRWQTVLADGPDTFPLAVLRVHCSAGTYVRRLADEIGTEVGVGTSLFSLLRANVDFSSS